MLNIAVLVSGGGTNLQALIDASNLGKIKNGRLALVVSNKPDAYALIRATTNNIPTCVVEKNGDRKDYDRVLIKVLKENKIDLIVLAGFMAVLGEDFINEFEGRIINVHPSLIPAFCGDGYYGLKVHKAVLEYGVKITGATVHFVNEITDGGEIILQKTVDIMEGDTPEILQKRVMETAEWEILPKAVSLFCEGRLKKVGRRIDII